MLKNDTLKNGTSRIGLYGNAPPGGREFVISRVRYRRVRLYLRNALLKDVFSEDRLFPLAFLTRISGLLTFHRCIPQPHFFSQDKTDFLAGNARCVLFLNNLGFYFAIHCGQNMVYSSLIYHENARYHILQDVFMVIIIAMLLNCK